MTIINNNNNNNTQYLFREGSLQNIDLLFSFSYFFFISFLENPAQGWFYNALVIEDQPNIA